MCAFTALRCCVVRWALARCACPAAWHCGAGKGGGVGRAAVPTAELECRLASSFSRQALSQADRHWSCDACDREHRGSEERDRAGAAGGEAATWEPSAAQSRVCRKLSLRRGRALTARCTTCRLHGRLCSLRMNHADRCVPAPRPLHRRTAGGRRWEGRSARGGPRRACPAGRPLTADDARSLYVGVVSGAPHTQWTARKSRRRVRGARTPATPVAAGRRPLRGTARVRERFQIPDCDRDQIMVTAVVFQRQLSKLTH